MRKIIQVVDAGAGKKFQRVTTPSTPVTPHPAYSPLRCSTPEGQKVEVEYTFDLCPLLLSVERLWGRIFITDVRLLAASNQRDIFSCGMGAL